MTFICDPAWPIDDRAQEEPPDLDEQPLDREELDEAIECIDDERVKAAIRRAFAELDDWRGREHRYEYVLVGGVVPPGMCKLATRAEADAAAENPGLGMPLVRVISTSKYAPYTPPPF